MMIQTNGMIMVDIIEQRPHNYFCETGNNNPHWKLIWAEPDESRHGQKYVFALK